MWKQFSITALWLTLAVAACDKKTPGASQSQATASAPASAPNRAPATLDPPPPWKFPEGERLVAIGDVHGDLQGTRRALMLAGAIDGSDRWVGGKLIVVQTGDQLDRGDDEREILDLFDRLKNQAREAGGTFIALNGNHEVMNVAGDFRYVTPAGFLSFAEAEESRVSKEMLRHFGSRERGRAAAFLPGGKYASLLGDRLLIAQVGDNVFVHGGVAPEHVRYGIDRMHAEIQAWMRGKLAQPSEVAVGANSPVWHRGYSLPVVDPPRCKLLEEALDALDAKRMVVGHTVQTGGISSACEGKVWRIDVGIASYYGDNPAEVLEIRGDAVKVLKTSRAQAAE